MLFFLGKIDKMFPNPGLVNEFSATPRGRLNWTGPIANSSEKMYFWGSFSNFWVFFQVILGVSHFGSLWVIFEYFRVRGIWVSLTGALNRKVRWPIFNLDLVAGMAARGRLSQLLGQLFNSVQTRCIVKGEAQKSPLFSRFSEGFCFLIQRATNGGQIRRGWIWRFWGAPIFGPEVPKYLFLKGFGTSGRKIGAPQKRQFQPRQIWPPICGPLTNAPCKTTCLYSAPSMHTLGQLLTGFSQPESPNIAVANLAWRAVRPPPKKNLRIFWGYF